MRWLQCAAVSVLWSGLVRAAGGYRSQEIHSDALVPLKTHSIAAPFVDSDLQNKFWDFGGDAIVDTSRHVRLTQDKSGQSGWLWSRSPISAADFQIDIEFNIDGHGSHIFGDGMAMWLTKERAQQGPIFGSKDHFTGFAVTFDTYANGHHAYNFPRINAITNDGSQSYDISQDGANLEVAGCSAEIRRPTVSTKARLTYIKGSHLEFKLHYENWEQWETCFTITNVTIPESPFLGFTSLTGDVSDNHDLISVESHAVITKGETAAQLKAEREAAQQRGKAGKKHHHKTLTGQHAGRGLIGSVVSAVAVLVKWAAILAVLAAIVFTGLRAKRKHDAKRF